MTAESTVESRFWPRARWGLALVLVLAMQMGFIFAFSDRSPVASPQKKLSPTIRLATGTRDELLLLSDPTLFVLPHRQGFSGETWLKIPPLTTSPFQWTEARQWLKLGEEELGATFNHFMGTNFFEAARFEMMPSPELTRVDVEPEIIISGKSSVHLGGALVGRGLRAPVEVPPWPYEDVIAPSRVQVLVDGAGNVIDALSLPSENPNEPATRLNKEADQNAVRLAKTARFEPMPKGGTDVTVGEMIFDWQIRSTAANTSSER